MKLEKIAPYLPYGLKGKVTLTMIRPWIEKIVTIKGIRYYRTHQPEPNELWQVMEADGSLDSLQGEYIKPILRPLSDLTKEIEHNGETFVPIIELAKEFQNQTIYKVSHYRDPEIHTTFIGEKFARLYCCVDGDNQRYNYFDVSITHVKKMKFSLVQKLISWHFDLENLIESGEAIDITLRK